MEDFGLIFALGFQGVYEGVDGGRDIGFDRWGCQGRGAGFGRTDGLRARALVFFALGGVVSDESAMKTSSLTNAFGSFGGGEFGQGDGINIHGVRIRGGLGGR